MDAIERQTLLTLMALISIHFFPIFFLQSNLTYMKRILHRAFGKHNSTLRQCF